MTEPWPEASGRSYRAAFNTILRVAAGGSDGPLRVTFLGQRNYFGPTTMPQGLPGLSVAFVHHVPGEDPAPAIASVELNAPHVLIVFRPELMSELLAVVDAPITIGMFTEPLPAPGWEEHPDLMRRWRDFQALNPASCDHYIGFNPFFRSSWERLVPIMTCMPLPVCDDAFVPVEEVQTPNPASGLFVGRVTDERNRFLMPLKHVFEWTVIDHGMLDVAGYSVALNLHNEDYPNFENRVPLHLARGHLVLTQPLSPEYDLFDGINLMTFRTPEELMLLVRQVADRPEAFRRVALRGRLAAESFRASTLWCDRLADVALILEGNAK